MAYGLGIDIGSSFTAAAIARCGGGTPVTPQPLNLGTRQSAVPSVLFVGDDGQVLIGEAAERRAVTRPECVVRGFKRRVGDTVPIMAGTRSIAPADAMAMMARWVVDRAQEREGEPPEAITLTHPAGWGEHKLGLLRRSLADAGLADVALLTEPEAAARHYASQRRVQAGSTVAVYDLGGGTFDAAVVTKHGEDSFELLGRPEGLERLGGADFDDAVFEHVVSSLDGPLTDLDPTDPEVLTALSRMRRECVEAKEALSYDAEASIPVLMPGRQSRIRLVRREFEGMIEDLVHSSIDSLGRALQTAHVESGELSAILLVGGSSRVPLVAELLSAAFDRPIAVDADPKASVCLGAAGSAVARLEPADSGTASGTGSGTSAGLEPAGTDSDTSAGPEQVTGAPEHGVPVPRSRGRRHHPSSRSAHTPAAVAPSAAVPSTAAAAHCAAAPLAVAPSAAAAFTRPDGANRSGGHRPASTHRRVSGARLRVRVAGASALFAVVAILTATAAQTPSGLDMFSSLGANAQADAPAGQSAAPAGKSPVQKTGTRRSAGEAARVVPEGILLSATIPHATQSGATTADGIASADEAPAGMTGQARSAVLESSRGRHGPAEQSPPVTGGFPQEADTPRAASGPGTSSDPDAPSSEAGRDTVPQSPGTPGAPAVPTSAPGPPAGTAPAPAPPGPTPAPERPAPPPERPAPAPETPAPAPPPPVPSLEPAPAPEGPTPGPGVGEGPAIPEDPTPDPVPPVDAPASQEG